MGLNLSLRLWGIIILAFYLCPYASAQDDSADILVGEDLNRDEPEQRFEKQSGDEEMLQDMESHLEEDLDQKKDREERVMERKRRLKLPANSPGSRAPESPPILQQMEDLHTDLSDDIVNVADNIDSFFVNDVIIEGRNRTNARLTNSFIFLDESGFINDFNARFRLKLPQLQNRLALEFTDEFEDDLDRGGGGLRNTSIAQARNTGGSQGGISFYESLKGIDTKLTGGLGYSNEVFAYLRFRITKNIVISQNGKMTFIHDFFDDTLQRQGQTGVLNYDYSFTKRHVLRFANEETYRDEFNTFETSHGFTFYHQLNDRNFLSYNYRARSVNPAGQSSFYLNLHTVDITYRRLLYRQHLFGEVAPILLFPKTENFEGLPGIIFKIEVIFGNV